MFKKSELSDLSESSELSDISTLSDEAENTDNTIDIIIDSQPSEEIEEIDDDNIPSLDITPVEFEPISEPDYEELPEQEDVDVAVEEVKEVELSEDDPEFLLKKLGPYDPRKDLELFKFPSLNLLKVYDNETAPVINQEEQQANANRIVTTLRNYGIEIESIKATVGPTVTLYEIVPQAGVRISKKPKLFAVSRAACSTY